jgi:hypothetical protein
MNIHRRLAIFAVLPLLVAVAAPARAQTVPAWSPSNVQWADPAPLGLSYEWTVAMGRRQTASLVGHVGALAWNVPTQPEGLKGWTHWSNWIALELTEAASVTVTVERQQGVVYSNGSSEIVARSALVPALSFYSGQDDTTDPEEHRYDNSGNFWSTVQFVGKEANARARTKIQYKLRNLAAGRYTIAIGGNPPAIDTYPSAGCAPDGDPVCYAYSGEHGYRVTIDTK